MLWIIIVPILVFIILFAVIKDPAPIYGIYSQPGKWYPFKYWIFNFMRMRRKRKSEQRPQDLTGKDAGYGLKSRSSEKEMDCVQQLSSKHPLV